MVLRLRPAHDLGAGLPAHRHLPRARRRGEQPDHHRFGFTTGRGQWRVRPDQGHRHVRGRRQLDQRGVGRLPAERPRPRAHPDGARLRREPGHRGPDPGPRHPVEGVQPGGGGGARPPGRQRRHRVLRVLLGGGQRPAAHLALQARLGHRAGDLEQPGPRLQHGQPVPRRRIHQPGSGREALPRDR